MYELFGSLVNKIYLTEVIADVRGDAYFKMKFPPKAWKTVEEEFVRKQRGDDFDYKFTILQRRDRKNRYKFVTQFLTEVEQKRSWIRDNIDDVKRKISLYVENMELDV